MGEDLQVPNSFPIIDKDKIVQYESSVYFADKYGDIVISNIDNCLC